MASARGSDQSLRETEQTLIPTRDHSQGHRLRLAERAYSDNCNDSNGPGDIFGLAFTQPASVNDAAFRVEVKAAIAAPCATNSGQETLAGA